MPVSTAHLRHVPQLLEIGGILRVRRQVLVAVDKHSDEMFTCRCVEQLLKVEERRK